MQWILRTTIVQTGAQRCLEAETVRGVGWLRSNQALSVRARSRAVSIRRAELVAAVPNRRIAVQPGRALVIGEAERVELARSNRPAVCVGSIVLVATLI